MDRARVSVIIPFFNRAKFLAESIESVLGQTYDKWEIILVDDGSTDDGPKIAQRYVEKYPDRVFLWSHEGGKNLGASSSRNLGIRRASGDFITFLDSDDVFMPRTLEIELAAFGRETDADVVCGTLQYWFSWSKNADKHERDFIVNLGLMPDRLYEPPSLLIHNFRAGGRKPGIGCVIVKSSFAKKYSLFEENFNYVVEDQIFWAKVSLHARIYVVSDCLARYRQHGDSSVSRMLANGNADFEWGKFADWLEKYLCEEADEKRDLWRAWRQYQKENRLRIKYRRLFNLYHRLLPYHVRYRLRDIITSWRS